MALDKDHVSIEYDWFRGLECDSEAFVNSNRTLQRQADPLRIREAVDFPGFVKVGPWLRAGDIFALSSRYEGFPNAFLEVMRLRRPCFSFHCPSGPKDLIEIDKNGLLASPKDVAAPSDAIRALASDAVHRNRLATEAQAVRQKFSVASIYARWTSVIDAAAVVRSGGAPLMSWPGEKVQ